MREPVCITWEQFVPRFEEIPGVYNGDKYVESRVRKIMPVGDGVPLEADDHYRLHAGRYSPDEEIHQKHLVLYKHATVATFNGAKVGVLNHAALWIAPEHRRRNTAIDLAAEMWAAESLARPLSFGGLEAERYIVSDKPIQEVRATINTSKRAYLLLVKRGYIIMPEGYVVP